jgi:hypothetical protein
VDNCAAPKLGGTISKILIEIQWCALQWLDNARY